MFTLKTGKLRNMINLLILDQLVVPPCDSIRLANAAKPFVKTHVYDCY